MNTPNVELIELFHNGDQIAFRRITNLFFADMRQFSYMFTGSVMEAEEIVQDCMVIVWQKRTEFKSVLSIKKFLLIIVRNKSINAIKKNGKRNLNLKNYIKVANDHARTETDSFSSQNYFLIETCIKNLPSKPREALSLILAGKTVKEIATIMKVEPATIRSTKARGVAQLRKIIQNQFAAISSQWRIE